MKRHKWRGIILITAILFLPMLGLAAPFLVSEPAGVCGESGLPACPATAEIFMDGVSIVSDLELEPDLSIRYDLGSMPVGEHVYTAIYRDALGRASVLSNPCLLLTPPGAPQNMDVRLK